jgi:hypothetical protein
MAVALTYRLTARADAHAAAETGAVVTCSLGQFHLNGSGCPRVKIVRVCKGAELIAPPEVFAAAPREPCMP